MISQHTIQQFNKGDEKAFREIYNQYWMLIYSRAILVFYQEDFVKEAVADAFILLLKKRGEINDEKHLIGYLLTTVRCRYLNYIVAEKTYNRNIDSYLDSGEYVDSEIFEYDNDVTNEDLLTKYLPILPPQSQRLVILCFIEGKSQREAADETGNSYQTVKNLLVYARKILRDLYKNKGNRVDSWKEKYKPSETTLKIYDLLLEGKKVKEIASELSVTIDSVYTRYKTYIKHFPEKIINKGMKNKRAFQQTRCLSKKASLPPKNNVP